MTTDLTVTVRYPGYVRKAIIRQSRSCCRWYVVKWLDEPVTPRRKRVCRRIKCDCGRHIAAGQAWSKHQRVCTCG